jgi:predicted phage baseplate assembly protein
VGDDPAPWREVTSLLDSGPNDHAYRVEIDDQGDATVVFGQGGTTAADGQFGLQPAAGAAIEAVYRVGGGSSGNVSADTLVQAHPAGLDALTWLASVSNPLPATGGRDLESRDHARRVAPPLFHDPLVAVTIADYERAAQQFSEPGQQPPVQRANAAFRWTGSWLTVTLGADPRSALGLAPELRSELLAYLDTRRLAGYDLEVSGPAYLPVDLILNFCVTPGFRSSAVQQQIELALSASDLTGGGKGFFHPDNFSFGDSLYTSRLFAAVMAVPGVDSARITRLARLHSAFPDVETQANLRQGFLAAGPDQIIRLDNDRNFPENGVLTVQSLERAQ